MDSTLARKKHSFARFSGTQTSAEGGIRKGVKRDHISKGNKEKSIRRRGGRRSASTAEVGMRKEKGVF